MPADETVGESRSLSRKLVRRRLCPAVCPPAVPRAGRGGFFQAFMGFRGGASGGRPFNLSRFPCESVTATVSDPLPMVPSWPEYCVIISPDDMNPRASDHGLEFLLAFDGRIHHLEKGYWLKFEIARVKATTNRPHGLSYSFTLHAPTATPLIRLANTHHAPTTAS